MTTGKLFAAFAAALLSLNTAAFAADETTKAKDPKTTTTATTTTATTTTATTPIAIEEQTAVQGMNENATDNPTTTKVTPEVQQNAQNQQK